MRGGYGHRGCDAGEAQLLEDAVEREVIEPGGARGRDSRAEAAHRQRHLEAGAAKIGVEHADVPLVHLDEFLGDRQAEAGARHRPVDAAIALPETLEDRLPQLRLHAWA